MSVAAQAGSEEDGDREGDLEAQADELREVVSHGEGVRLREVEDKVRHRVDEVREERDPHETPVRPDGGKRQ